jgi:hypothetical protein
VISLRYHMIAIVSVFLALAVGLLVGGAFVQPVLQRELESRTAQLQESNAQYREQVDEVRAQLEDVRVQMAAVDAFAEVALPYLAVDRLAGTSVIVVTQEGVEDTVLGETQRSLAEAGADVMAVVSARDELASEDPETRARLAELIGRPDALPEELPAIAAEALAGRIANGDGGAAPEDDLLARLLSAGFLAPVGAGLSEEVLDEIGLLGQIVVVLAGGEDVDPALAPDAFAVPLVRELTALDVPVAAGESTTTAVPFVQLVRDGGVDEMVTVDDLDLSMGGAALVLGLDRLLTSGQGGSYGVKDGAEPLPSL